MMTEALTVGSVFSGIGALDLAFERAGCRTIWQIENDPQANKVLMHHWPNVERHGDIRGVDGTAIPSPDGIIAGFPCPDFSMAGRRAGLVGGQGQLFFELCRILRDCAARWFIFENVAGLLSSDGGRDFAVVLGCLTGCLPSRPARSWGRAGFARGPRAHLAWRVLDAQYFGVPQQRRRVVIVGHSPALGGCCAKVLFESQSGTRNPAPSTSKRKDTAAIAHVGSASIRGARRRRIADGVIAATLDTRHSVDLYSARGNHLVVSPAHQQEGFASTGAGFWREGTGTLTAHDSKDPMQLVVLGGEYALGGTVTHALRSVGADASETGDGTGTPLVIVPFDTTQVTSRENRSNPQPGDPCHTLSFFGDAPAIAASVGVRRLTPIECHRLQGLPDDWCASVSDSAQYRLLGNAVAVPVFEWVARRLVAVLP